MDNKEIITKFHQCVRKMHGTECWSLYYFMIKSLRLCAVQWVIITHFRTCFSCHVFSSAQYPSLRSEPTSVVQAPGSAVRLQCSVNPPSALVSWRFRGLPMDRDMLPGLELGRDSLVISNFTPDHAGVYQCVARLSHGPAVASRLARVALAGTLTVNNLTLHTSLQRVLKKERKRPWEKEVHFCECRTFRKDAYLWLIAAERKEAVEVFYLGNLPDASWLLSLMSLGLSCVEACYVPAGMLLSPGLHVKCLTPIWSRVRHELNPSLQQ